MKKWVCLGEALASEIIEFLMAEVTSGTRETSYSS